MGYLKKERSRDDKQALLALIEDYRQEQVPPVAPLPVHLRPSAACSGTRCRGGREQYCVQSYRRVAKLGPVPGEGVQ